MTANRLADVSTQQICRNHIIPRKPPRSTLRGSQIHNTRHAADWRAPCAVFHSCHHRECRRQRIQHRRQYIHRKGSGPHGNHQDFAITLPLMNLVMAFCTLIAASSATIFIFLGQKNVGRATDVVNNVMTFCLIHSIVLAE